MNRQRNFIKVLGMVAMLSAVGGSLPAVAATASSTPVPLLAQTGADVLFNRGVQKLQQRDYQGAIADFSALIERESGNANAYLGRAIAYRNQENYQAALEDYNASLSLNSTNANAYLGRGITKRKTGDDRGAIEDYTQALRYNEDYGQAYYNRGLSKVELGDLDGAIADFRQAARLYREQELISYYQDALARIVELEETRSR
ncbi:MAG: tetratricopeptide repeat protein [Cyanobacteriota bacterium]|nr:tetratricopeptide repeat protein [Cyanobacteriota bacterium]